MNLDFSDIKVLVVGDFMLDHYITGYSNRMSPEAPVPVILPKEEYSVPGGAGNVALNLNSMGVQVSCIGVIGNDMSGKTLIELLSNKGIDVSSFVSADKHQTTLKKRIYCDKKQLLRIDKEKILNSSYNKKINNLIKDKIKDCDILILSDYNKGVLNEDTISYAIKSANIPVIIDPKKKNFSIYGGATILTPNLKELRRASNIIINNNDSIIQACNKLIEENKLDYIVTTKGSEGITIVGENFFKHINTTSINDADVTGAGDTAVSALSVAFAKTKNIEVAASFANIVANIVVQKQGTSVASMDQIKKLINNNKKDL